MGTTLSFSYYSLDKKAVAASYCVTDLYMRLMVTWTQQTKRNIVTIREKNKKDALFCLFMQIQIDIDYVMPQNVKIPTTFSFTLLDTVKFVY